ncbi:hypothetical protein DSCO28_45180 [Desulfosarcina ovata subsp. sediminis]|uniref:Uncharacterized protein n=1 Tax=Desulfosarcina ovata subsp. sediminis TaxID=885957 RepID=A0A5K7ZUP5_9BACT|nr:hypothetical protein DSCO28_45180 [Desulfosarcina ovata subsp. sediminis]
MNVKDQMKNSKWWYFIYFKIDFILNLKARFSWLPHFLDVYSKQLGNSQGQMVYIDSSGFECVLRFKAFLGYRTSSRKQGSSWHKIDL